MKHFNRQIFAQYLEAKRAREGITWAQVAQRTGVGPSTLCRIQQGKGPDVEAFLVLCLWAKMPLEQLSTAYLPAPPPPSPDNFWVDFAL